MKRLGILAAAGVLFAAAPSFAQTVGTCPRGGGANQPQPVRVLFALNSSVVPPAENGTATPSIRNWASREACSP